MNQGETKHFSPPEDTPGSRTGEGDLGQAAFPEPHTPITTAPGPWPRTQTSSNHKTRLQEAQTESADSQGVPVVAQQ